MNHVFDRIMGMKADWFIVAFLAFCVVISWLFSTAICFGVMWMARWLGFY